MIASDILSALTDSDLDMTVCKLISIQGEHLLLNLVSTSGCQSITSQHSHSVWKKQASALVTEEVSVLPLSQNRFHLRPSPSVSGIILTPHRLRPICDRGNQLEVLSLLANNCTLQPSSACFHVDMISSLILHDLLSEKFALDNSLEGSVACTSVTNSILRSVVILRLQCEEYSFIGVMISIIQSATTKGNDFQLKQLFCTLPNLYIDIVQPLSNLFLLQSFQKLNLELDEVYLLSLSKLLQGFMTALYARGQQLTIHLKETLPLPKAFEASQLAALDLGDATVPQCAVQHKTIKLSSPPQFTRCLHLLLQLPTI